MALPPDLARSVEVHVVNQTKFRLTVESCRTTGSSQWIAGETPTQGQTIAMYQDTIWGVYTAQAEDAVNAVVTLVGIGDGPATLSLQMGANGVSSAPFIGNNGLAGAVTEVNSDEGDMAQYQPILTQLVPMATDTP